MTGRNMQWALLAKCRSQRGSELQFYSAMQLLKRRTLKLPAVSAWNCFHGAESLLSNWMWLFFFPHFPLHIYHHFFEQESPSYSHCCFPTDAINAFWTFSISSSWIACYLQNNVYIMYTIASSVTCGNYSCFFTSALQEHTKISGFDPQHCTAIHLPSPGWVFSHSAYTPLSYILSNVLAFTYMVSITVSCSTDRNKSLKTFSSGNCCFE